MGQFRHLFGALCILAVWAMMPRSADAIPLLQLYVEGGTYDDSTESWELMAGGSTGGAPFRIWTIGNISGEGGKGPILNVKLAAVYDAAVGPITITLTPTLIGGTGSYGGFTDLSLPSIPLVRVGSADAPATDGTTPLLGDGKPLPSHDEYGPGRIWQEFGLGDFNTADSPVGDFIDGFPASTGGNKAQINAYDVTVTSLSGSFGVHPFTIHFDLYDTVYAKNHAKSTFAPFSHDADGDVSIVPEPATTVLMGLGLLGMMGARGLSRRRDGTSHQVL